ncbi:hypothetical protein QQS21_004885 [Conoideocrella luteorostrata]|uniref:Uncharacterized protein n=1 Tax=Conoideocrella luteorostrata TaxID=1105319 RepID=A0AAJ0CQI4_9HYPO|nr:hypothetical protein QQS21_004885 [Conoideocrella luteorostrata]
MSDSYAIEPALAIDWAVDDQRVDVIATSYVVDSDPDQKLQKAIKKAIDNKALDQSISGSSVAVALAARIASVSITGDGLPNPGRKYCATSSEAEPSGQMRSLSNLTALPSRFGIVKHPDAMIAEGSDKHAPLEKICKAGNTGAGKGSLYNDPYMPNVEEFLDDFCPEGEKKYKKW